MVLCTFYLFFKCFFRHTPIHIKDEGGKVETGRLGQENEVSNEHEEARGEQMQGAYDSDPEERCSNPYEESDKSREV